MCSSDDRNVGLTKGDILRSTQHALVNTVNCVGIMGKGIALIFKNKYPAMFEDYVERCERNEVRLGEPYVYDAGDHLIVNFPTKQHWRSVSRLSDIEAGLGYLKEHLSEWGIKSIAVPPLGCGNGQLDWSVVGTTLVRHLKEFGIPVELYVPYDLSIENAQLSLFEACPESGLEQTPSRPRVPIGQIALVDILQKVESEEYHWPVGRIMFQKLAYFATVAGIPTGLKYEANSYGPYADGVKKIVAHLQNNGLVMERRRGQMFETVVGPTYEDARREYEEDLKELEPRILRVADLLTRFDSTKAEVAATVHFTAMTLRENHSRSPEAGEVIDAVERWKVRRNPPLRREDVGRSLVSLATQGWIMVIPDESVEQFVEELMPF